MNTTTILHHSLLRQIRQVTLRELRAESLTRLAPARLQQVLDTLRDLRDGAETSEEGLAFALAQISVAHLPATLRQPDVSHWVQERI